MLYNEALSYAHLGVEKQRCERAIQEKPSPAVGYVAGFDLSRKAGIVPKKKKEFPVETTKPCGTNHLY